ncbi:MAG TPA: hypothetical protein PLR06_14150, partial [Cyclobacteriaceae bacterium]|nr:hypothetical protein [Cyclobacteriaceae bacterium]
AILEPIIPRLYSIASSQKMHENEVHITVARKCFTVNGEVGYGLCSDYLTKLRENSALDFYVHRNSQFRLPSSQTDVIMIGPGTGIAPFRAFLEERDATGAQGRNWLFFGDQHFESDFLYQTELQNFEKTGVLTRINVAFSRDQESKIYVQHRMIEQGKEFFSWLESGAHLYICGTLDPMSIDVEQALLQIISAHGGKSAEQAQVYLEELKGAGRYLRDVY